MECQKEQKIPFYSRIVLVLPVSAFEPSFSVFIPSVFLYSMQPTKADRKTGAFMIKVIGWRFQECWIFLSWGCSWKFPFLPYIAGIVLSTDSFCSHVWYGALHSTVQWFSFLRCFHLVIWWTFPCPSRCSTEFPTAVIIAGNKQPFSLLLLRIRVKNGD